MQPTERPLSIRQPNWHRMEKQAASPRRSSKNSSPSNVELKPRDLLSAKMAEASLQSLSLTLGYQRPGSQAVC